jgi:homoserine acetyltransferase
MKTLLTFLLFLLITLVQVASSQEQQTARIGDLKLENGNVIRDCLIGYRTFGRLNSDKTNAVLFPTAFGWRSDGLASRIGPGKLIDSGKYFVIAVDSLGDGISSSPSNSQTQPDLAFPQFSIRDMVSAEQKLVVETLGLRHLSAVIGFSMGGMQDTLRQMQALLSAEVSSISRMALFLPAAAFAWANPVRASMLLPERATAFSISSTARGNIFCCWKTSPSLK